MMYTRNRHNDHSLLLWEYHVFSEPCWNPDFGDYTSYGIQIFQRQEQAWQSIAILHDISSHYERAEYLATLFTREQVSPIHFLEVLEDLLP